jgi:hypothetical protein
MDNIFIIAAVISIVFLIAKFLEMRFVEKESKPLKLLIRDALIVYFSVVSANFILEQLNPVLEGGKKLTPVFTDNPGF